MEEGIGDAGAEARAGAEVLKCHPFSKFVRHEELLRTHLDELRAFD